MKVGPEVCNKSGNTVLWSDQ